MENIVIGIEGKVGAGKTSICRKLLDKIENSIILHGGNIYRAIVYGMAKSPKINKKDKLDAFEIMKDLGIEIRLEDRETVIYMNGNKLDEKDLQSQKASMAVSPSAKSKMARAPVYTESRTAVPITFKDRWIAATRLALALAPTPEIFSNSSTGASKTWAKEPK